MVKKMFSIGDAVKVKNQSVSERQRQRLDDLITVYYERLSRGKDVVNVFRKIEEITRGSSLTKSRADNCFATRRRSS